MSESDPFPEDSYFRELKGNDPHYTAVGWIASSWARLEFEIDKMIWGLANAEDDHGACVTAQFIGTGPRMRALMSLVRLQSMPEDIDAHLNKFANETEPLQRRRNRIVHDSWMVEAKTGRVAQLRVTAERTLDYRMRPATMTGLVALHKDITAHRKKLELIGDRITRAMTKALSEKLKKPPSEARED